MYLVSSERRNLQCVCTAGNLRVCIPKWAVSTIVPKEAVGSSCASGTAVHRVRAHRMRVRAHILIRVGVLDLACLNTFAVWPRDSEKLRQNPMAKNDHQDLESSSSASMRRLVL